MSHFFSRNYVGVLPGTPATRRKEVLGANGSEPDFLGQITLRRGSIRGALCRVSVLKNVFALVRLPAR